MSQNHNIFLKYENDTLLWSDTETGSYREVTSDEPKTKVNGTDTITFKAISGIDKLKKIDGGLDGTKKMIKSKKGEGSSEIVVTIKDTTTKGEIDKYNIILKPIQGPKEEVTVDPKIEGEGNP